MNLTRSKMIFFDSVIYRALKLLINYPKIFECDKTFRHSETKGFSFMDRILIIATNISSLYNFCVF